MFSTSPIPKPHVSASICKLGRTTLNYWYKYLIWRSLAYPRSSPVTHSSAQDSEPHCPLPQPKVSLGNYHGNKLVMNGAVVAMVMGCSLSLSLSLIPLTSPPLFSMNQSDQRAPASPGGVGRGVGTVRRGSWLRKREDGLNL